MKQLAFLILFLFSIGAYSQDELKYPVIVTNNFTVEDTVCGNPSVSPIINLKNHYARILQDYVISGNGFSLTFDSFNVYKIRASARMEMLDLSESMGASWDYENAVFSIGDNSGLYNDSRLTIYSQLGQAVFSSCNILPINNSVHDIGDSTHHWRTIFVDYIAGYVNTPALDSVTAYAVTPLTGQTFFCTDCTGNGCTGKLMTWTGSLWRRYACE